MTEVSNKINISTAGATAHRGDLADGKYIEAVGRRKTAVARVRISASSKNTYTVNGKTLNAYFPIEILQNVVRDPLNKAKIESKFSVTAKVNGGGINAQAEAIRHGIARALVDFDIELRKPIKKLGFLKRDPRAKERKKFGLKGARRAPQWSKR
jgi:small subunit ribosomal protein S9